MNDFDFLSGSWNVLNRRLTGGDWTTFPGTSTCRPILGGVGNTDEIVFPTLGSSGFTLRLYDVTLGQWSIYWANSRSGVLLPPVTGTFADGRGDFYGDDEVDGRPVRVHFLWSDITPESARWEQEFSTDGGRTWESNWVMEFSRA